MKKFVIGLVAGFVLAGLTGVVLLFAAMRLGDSRPSVKDGSTLVLNLSGSVPEHVPMELPFPGLETQTPVTLHEIWRMLDEAAVDPKIAAIAFFPSGVDAGWGKMQEIRKGLLDFKASGKPLIAYLRNPTAREYYLATAADRIYMSREELLNLKGLRIEALYLKNTLDKLGIEVQIEHAGRYKDAGDTVSRDSMSPETREVLDSILDELYGFLVSAIGEARDIDPVTIRQIIDEGPFLAPQALENGLIDGLLYEDELYEQLQDELGQDELTKLAFRTYNRHVSLKAATDSGKEIAYIVGAGAIMSGSGESVFTEEEAIRSRDFIRTLRRVRKSERIQGAILRIDSPGGDAIASDEILREVRLLAEQKPLVISMSDVAASGGYYIAMSGDPVLAYPNTFTGSIGVIYGKANLRGLYEKVGAHKEILTRGRFAAIDSDYTSLNEEEREKLREGIHAVYDTFLSVVAEGRDRSREEIEPLAEGRVWLGSQAEERGLVDELGGLDRAVEMIKERAGIPLDERARLVPYPPAKHLLDYLMGNQREALRSRLREVLLPGGFGAFSLAEMELLHQGRTLRLMPYNLTVR